MKDKDNVKLSGTLDHVAPEYILDGMCKHLTCEYAADVHYECHSVAMLPRKCLEFLQI